MIELPIWMIAFFALALVVLLVVSVVRVGSPRSLGWVGPAAGLALLVGTAWIYLDRLGTQDRAEHRRQIEARLSAITAQSLLPNSNLACLDISGEDLVQEACEKALFSSPEQVSAALTFVGLRLDVLREISALPKKEEAVLDRLRAPLARTIEADLYGLVAQVLQSRDGCSADQCPAFIFLKNYAQIAANMQERAYAARITKHASTWSDKPAPAPAAASPAPQAQLPAPKESQLNLNFPSSSSIPPVSIMANEPGIPGQNGVEPGKQPPAARRPPPQKSASQPKQTPPRAAPAVPGETLSDPFPQPIAPPQTTGGPNNPKPQ
jgi:hypothetical protein